MTTSGPIVLIADDLTGALDAAAPFAERGYSTRVVPSYAVAEWNDDTTEVVVLTSDTRDGDPLSAQARLAGCVTRALAVSPSLIGIKVDSLLRGTPALDIAAAAAGVAAASETFASRTSHVFIAPAFPAQQRITRNSSVFVADVALDRTEHHASGNAPTVSSLAAATGLRTVIVGVDELRASGFAAHLSGAVADGPVAVIFDAETDDDLATIVEQGLVMTGVLWVGSAGIFEQLAEQLAEQSAAARRSQAGEAESATVPAHTPRDSPQILIAVGSASSAASAQVDALDDAQVGITNIAEVDAIGEASQKVRLDLDRSGVAAIRPLVRHSPFEPLNDRHSHLVAGVVAAVRDSFNALVVVGGTTANDVFHTLGVQGLRVTAAPSRGMSAGFTEPAPHISFVSKAGSFGEPSSLIQAVNFLQAQSKGTS